MIVVLGFWETLYYGCALLTIGFSTGVLVKHMRLGRVVVSTPIDTALDILLILFFGLAWPLYLVLSLYYVYRKRRRVESESSST